MPLPWLTGVALRTAAALLASSVPRSHADARAAQTAATASSAPGAAGTVVFGGDIVPHRDLLTSFEQNGATSLFEPIASLVGAADLAFANFESPAAPSRPLTPSIVRFNVHADFVQAVAAAGFDGVVMANNHSFDTGVAGVGETIATLRAAGLRAIGGALPGESPIAAQSFPLAGRTLCVMSATRILNFDMTMPGPGQPRIGLARPDGVGEPEAFLEMVRHERSRCGALIVSLHSGVEYQDRPEPIDRVFFRRVAEAGADVVIAHHSHTVQPLDVVTVGSRRVPIFNSLGNLVSNQGNHADANAGGEHPSIGLDVRLREGVLAVLRFEPDVGAGLRLTSFGYVPLWTVNTHFRTPPGEAPRIAAALMPREGGGDAMLTAQWRAVLHRMGGEQYLAPLPLIPEGAQTYARSDAVVLATRRAARGP